MNNYTGKICPFCKTEFKPNDEIVVCSECDMPHHKDCWIENQGCTTFGCLGTIKSVDNVVTSVTSQHIVFEDSQSRSVENSVYCTRCGSQNAATSLFCSRCGNRLTTPEPTLQAPVYSQSNSANQNPYAYVNQQNYPNQQSNYSSCYSTYQSESIDTDIQQLIGTKAEYYIPKFQAMKAQNKLTSWNWSAFLFTPYWMIYRKMYGYGAGFLAISFVLFWIGSGFLSLLSLAGYIALGIYGNYIYMKFLERKMTQAKSMNEPFKSKFIIQNSGVNTMATVLTIVGYAILAIIISV